jgi:hypothetical protein
LSQLSQTKLSICRDLTDCIPDCPSPPRHFRWSGFPNRSGRYKGRNRVPRFFNLGTVLTNCSGSPFPSQWRADGLGRYPNIRFHDLLPRPAPALIPQLQLMACSRVSRFNTRLQFVKVNRKFALANLKILTGIKFLFRMKRAGPVIMPSRGAKSVLDKPQDRAVCRE